MTRLMRWLRSPWPAATLLTLVTLGTIGAVVVVATPAGCRLIQNAGLHINGSKCQNPSQVARIPSPSPLETGQPVPTATPGQGTPSSNPCPPCAPGCCPPSPSTSPFETPSSSVPHDPSLPPYEFGGSGSYPPTYDTASSVGGSGGVALNCRLPIYAAGPGSGGFLVFPDRSFIGDPRSGVTVPSPAPGATPPPQGGYGYQGFFGLTYDRALARWVPVPRAWVAPDGKRYAYPGPTEGIYVVDVASNTQTEIGDGSHWQVLDVEAEGVYAVQVNAAGLWLVPFSGSASQVTNAGYWTAIGGGAAYGTETSALPQGVATRIERFDLATHTTQHWFQVDNATSSPYGFDAAGHPIMLVNAIFNPGLSQLWVVKGLGSTEVLTSNLNFTGPPVGDSHGIWLMSYQTTYLLVPGQALYAVAAVGGQLAGGCA
jgi:hypothetical protein